jgi:uncharacterized protein (TIGR03067 family)
MRRARLLLLLASLGFAPAPLTRRDRTRQDPTDVAGSWEFVSCELNGKTNPGIDTLYQVEMTRESFVYARKDGRGRHLDDVRLDPKASPPSVTRSMGKHVPWVGSYRLRGDEIEMIFRQDAEIGRRPTDFDGKPPYRYLLRRVGR